MFISHSSAILADDLANRHDEPNLAPAVRQPDQDSIPMPVCCDMKRLALRAACFRRPQIKAEDANFAILPEFAFYLLIAPDGLSILQFLESHSSFVALV